MKHISPIIGTSYECNMGCKYCYIGCMQKNFPDVKKVNEEFKAKIPLLLKFTDEVVSYNKFTRTIFYFRGGEPLLINVENWREILNYFRVKNYSIISSIQTNGTLINNDFINLFKEFNLKIGVSLDGPASMNDQTRVFKNGRGTFSIIFKNLQKLKNAGVEFSCLLTLNKTNIKNIKAIYTFFKKNNISFNVMPIFETNFHVPKNLLITPQEYANTFCKLFDLWFDDSETNPFLIKEFVTLIEQFIKPSEGKREGAFMKNCSKHFVYFDLEGNLWSCNTLLYTKDTFFYGNIQKDNLTNILNSSKPTQLQKRWEILSKTDCKNCEFAKWCYGGCGSRGYYYYGNYFKKDYFCEAYKIILKHTHEKIKSSLRNEVD
ncbi:hypothetical protein CVT91_06305 [Candidatus Atribacteria bacterium HGW-Atribacteria-1]|nr:MAG: hypothetical protein CVT91_06305 [Candidatus Atribacteria bacterium HGW-Atribacteria-1]